MSRFNLTIEYRPGEDNDGADALSRWAYAAGEAQDTNFHGSDAHLEGWRDNESDEWHRIRSELKSQKPFQFREEQAMVFLLQSATVHAVKCVHSPFCVPPDGSVCGSSDDVCRMHFVDNPDSGQGLSVLSWHMPGVERLCQDIKSIKVPPAISRLSDDWESRYADDPFMADHWDVLNRDKAISVKGKDYALYQGKVRVDGRIYVPLASTDQVLGAQHSYAHPGVQKTLEMFRQRYVSGHTDADLRAKISAMIGSCAVCKTCKARCGLQPESCHSFPIPDLLFSTVSMDFCDMGQENATEIRGVTYDYLFVVVCPLTGYTMPIPCSTTITAPQLAELYLERVVGLMGLPNEIFSDHDDLITADFFMTLCDLSGVQQKQSPIYRPRSNGTAERAVQVVLDNLRTFLAQTGKRDGVRLLPLDLWTINDVPGPVSGYSPHLLVFGRQPIGSGDCPLVIPEHGSEDAVSFFRRLVEDRKYVQKKLQDIHDKASRRLLQQHPPHVYQDGERVWYQNHKKNSNKNKLHRLWKGPAEVLGRVPTNQYMLATDKGEMILDAMRIQPYIPSSPNEQTPLHYYTDQ